MSSSQAVVQDPKKDVEKLGVDEDPRSSDKNEEVEYETDSSDDSTASSQ